MAELVIFQNHVVVSLYRGGHVIFTLLPIGQQLLYVKGQLLLLLFLNSHWLLINQLSDSWLFVMNSL